MFHRWILGRGGILGDDMGLGSMFIHDSLLMQKLFKL
jgi:hypothetical protein